MSPTVTLVAAILLGVALLVALGALWLALRRRPDGDPGERLGEQLGELRGLVLAQNERLERELRAALESSAGQVRIETGARLAEIQAGLVQQLNLFGGQVAAVAERTEETARWNRSEGGEQLGRFGTVLHQQLGEINQQLRQNLTDVRTTLEARLSGLQQGNEAKLEIIRATVEERLQSTLEARLGESFRLVSEQLDKVHRGLGEMQGLALGVGDLKRVLTNVRSRGMFGEVQLGVLLEQVLTVDQYASNVATRPNSNERVEFAIRMPGTTDGASVWLPIDAKFPTEDYERLVLAIETADREAIESCGRALERRIRDQAATIRAKYIEPPHTMDFAILFLPSEGLFAEVLRRPGLSEALHRDLRIVVAGPTTLAAMLNALQMGFRSLALEKRSAEVWQVLGAVKTEFVRFADVLSRLKTQLASASDTVEKAETRSRAMERKLKAVESLPVEQPPLFPVDVLPLEGNGDPPA